MIELLHNEQKSTSVRRNESIIAVMQPGTKNIIINCIAITNSSHLYF